MEIAKAYAITLARELRQVSQGSLCERIGVAQGTLSKIENEQLPATNELVAQIAQALALPASFFYQDFEYRNLPQTYFRKYNITQSLTKSIRAKITVLREHVKTLLDSVEMPEDRVPAVSLEEYAGSIEGLAAELRVHWNVRPGPVPNLTALLEKMGVLVLECDFGTAKVDAVSLRDNELPPTIFINPKMQGDRWRFTMAHELAHLIMHHGRFMVKEINDIEAEAHRFASSFLMPAKDIGSQLIGRLTLDKLASLKSHWGVSMQALIMRAADLHRITDSQKRRLFMEMSKLGYRRDEPVYIEREQPTFVNAVVRFHMEELEYSVQELAAALNVLEDDLYKLYPRAIRSPLRLVKE
jgi:Zn-dependent peptidase ImmA (M78 family)/transcriptional regulator with XRE-family HTH domain